MATLTFRFHRKQTRQVASLQEASTVWNAYVHQVAIETGEAGCSHVGNGGTVRDEAGKLVGRISYNGRMWDASGKEVA